MYKYINYICFIFSNLFKHTNLSTKRKLSYSTQILLFVQFSVLNLTINKFISNKATIRNKNIHDLNILLNILLIQSIFFHISSQQFSL